MTSYNNRVVYGKFCPKCLPPTQLIVKERRMRQRGMADYVTNFLACPNWEINGCNHTEEFTPAIKASLDVLVVEVSIEF